MVQETTFPIISKSEEGKEVVNARELWKALETTVMYAKWIKRRITDNEFAMEGVDYLEIEVLDKNGKNPLGGRPSKEYALTLDFAKRISMMEKTAKSEMVRKYFVECEKQLKEMVQSAPRLPKTYKEALVELLAQVEENEKLLEENKEKEEVIQGQLAKIEEDKPKVEFADDILSSNDTISVNNLAKLICNIGYEIGPNQLYEWLRQNGYVCVKGAMYNTPKQTYVTQGLLIASESRYKRGNETKIAKSTRVTSKGQKYFLDMFKTFVRKGECKYKLLTLLQNDKSI